MVQLKAFLQSSYLTIFGQTFDSSDLRTVNLRCQRAATLGCDPINQNNTGSTLTSLAANLGTRKPQVVAQHIRQ
jgi:hypothetical protein